MVTGSGVNGPWRTVQDKPWTGAHGEFLKGLQRCRLAYVAHWARICILLIRVCVFYVHTPAVGVCVCVCVCGGSSGACVSEVESSGL